MPRFFRLQEGWLTVGLLALLLFSVTLSIQQAQWSDGLSILTPITIIGLASGIILAKVRGVPRILLDLVGLLIGVVTVLVAVASIMSDVRLVTIQDKVQDLLVRTGTWIGVALRQDMSDDLLVFILSLAIVSWVLAYSSAYFVFKSRQLWWALVPSGVALLINLSYSPVNLNSYIIIYMFSALLLMIRFNLLMQEERWQRERINYSPNLTWGFLWAGSAVSVVLALAMWFVPTTAVNSTLNGVWGKVNQPWVDFQTRMSALWAQVPGNQAIGGYSSFNDSFSMGGALNLSDSTALIVKSNERLYMRARTYDQYDGVGWKDTAPDSLHPGMLPNSSSKLALPADQQLISDDQSRTPITYSVQVVHPKGDVIFAAARPVQLSTPSRLDVSWMDLHQTFNVETTSPFSETVPQELRPLMGMLYKAESDLKKNGQVGSSLDIYQELLTTSQGSYIQDQKDNLQKRGLIVTFRRANDHSLLLQADGQVPVYEDLTALTSVDDIAPNAQYTVTSLSSVADENDLRQTSTSYEDWLKRYLNVPTTLPDEVRTLALKIVNAAGATGNPYDEAKAIEAYLRNNYKYNTSIPLPPSNTDRLDWFLFTNKEGYCEYYAGAMVIMLRTLGVPTRMASGYAPGTYDATTGAYTIRESSAHTWPEVYFPGYGWIQFEPTPSQVEVVHGPQPIEDTSQPTPEASPFITPGALKPPTDHGVNDPGLGSQGGGVAAGVRNALPWGLLLLAIGALLAIFTWWIPVLPWANKNKPAASASFYYSRMLRWSRLLGLGPAAHQTPYEFSESVAREVPGTSLLTRSITRAYVRERFSKDELPTPDRVAVLRAWDSLRGRLWRVLPSRQLKRTLRRRGR